MFIAVGTPSRRGDGHADLSFVYAAAEEIAARARRLHRGGDQVDRAGRHGRRDRSADQAAAARRRRRGGLQPGVPARGRGDRRLQAAGPGGGRARRRAGAGGDGRALPAAQPERDADAVHRPAHLGADQVRRQRLPGDEDHLHQRDGRPVRSRRRRRAAGRPRHRARQAHRVEVPARRPGLRRLLLSEGHAGAGAHRGRRGPPAHAGRDDGRSQRSRARRRWPAR